MSKIREITGQRIGQLIYNSMNYTSFDGMSSSSEIGEKLFYIEDEELTVIVKEYLKTITALQQEYKEKL